nr:hypothetical protein [Ktedonobacteraceae bacterium]
MIAESYQGDRQGYAGSQDDRQGELTRATARVAPTILRCPLCSFSVYSRGDPGGRPGNHSQAPVICHLLACSFNGVIREKLLFFQRDAS